MQKRFILSFLLGIFILSVFCHEKDTRGLFKYEKINDFTITENGKIWAVDDYDLIVTDDKSEECKIYENFCDSIRGVKGTFNTIKNITFFDSLRGIITGYISGIDDIAFGYLITDDGGKSWNLRNWDYNVRDVVDLDYDTSGNIWIVSLYNDILYSSDYGLNWIKKHIPEGRSYSKFIEYRLFMQDDTLGVVKKDGSNVLLLTRDNWETYDKILIPFDDDNHYFKKNHYDKLHKECAVYDNQIIVEYNRRVFYTELDSLSWQEYKDVNYFIIDKMHHTILLQYKHFNLHSFSTLDDSINESACIADNYGFGNKLSKFSKYKDKYYILSGGFGFYSINDKKKVKFHRLSNDIDIEVPYLKRAKDSDSRIWGFRDGFLLIKENNTWYRLDKLDFNIRDINILSDSTAILWDGEINNYKYNIDTGEIEEYIYQDPFERFLSYPLKSMQVQVIPDIQDMNCRYTKLTYEIKHQKMKLTDLVVNCDDKSVLFRKKHNTAKLLAALQILSNNQLKKCTLDLPDFSREDIKNYLKLAYKKIQGLSSSEKKCKIKELREFHINILDRLDSLSQKYPCFYTCNDASYLESNLNIEITNSNNDILRINKKNTIKAIELIKCELNNMHFLSANFKFIEILYEYLPEEFPKSYVPSNSQLLMELADYFFEMESHDYYKDNK